MMLTTRSIHAFTIPLMMNTDSSPPSLSQRHRFQISLSAMLLMMIVFAFISAALFYASKVPMVREEISLLIYGEAKGGGEDVGRVAHRAFIMFTFTSPLIMACVFSLAVSLLKKFQLR
ncbi:MAG: hypothetical protein AAF802_05430 [Planctomycetota bacterium]